MSSNSVYLDRTATALHCIFVAISETASAVQCSTNCKLQISGTDRTVMELSVRHTAYAAAPHTSKSANS